MNIPALIAAIAFAILVIMLAVPLWKLGKVFDELRGSVKEVTNGAQGTISEATKTIAGANAQLDKVDAITTSTAQVAQDISALSTLMSATVATPFIKVAAFSHATRRFFSSKKKDNQ